MAIDAGRRRVGVIVVPKYFDTTSKELTTLAPSVDVLHTQLRLHSDFGFTLDEIVRTGPEVSDCAAALAEAGAEVVVQLGTPFSTAHGWDAGNMLRSEIEQRIGVPFEMMGLSVPAGALALGMKRLALATTYYGPEWVARYIAFLDEAGLETIHEESFVDQGVFSTHEAAWAESFDGFHPHQVVETIRQVAARAGDVDGIVLPGLPCRFLDRIQSRDEELGLRVVSYYAIWWKCLERLGLRGDHGNGALVALAS
jgi:maleate cis-trans isomerase